MVVALVANVAPADLVDLVKALDPVVLAALDKVDLVVRMPLAALEEVSAALVDPADPVLAAKWTAR